jgi:AcrR family transcriptional regulator
MGCGQRYNNRNTFRGCAVKDSKKTKIIEAAVHLLAKGDYHSTSVQDIANQAGVAKGSFYLHFRSKEDLLISIYEYFFETFQSMLDELSNQVQRGPKERIIEAFRVQWAMVTGHMDMLSLHIKNSAVFQTEQAQRLVRSGSTRILGWFEREIVAHFGTEAQSCAMECAVMISGLFKEYLFMHLFLGVRLQEKDVSEALFERLEALVAGFVDKQGTVLLRADMIEEQLQIDANAVRLEVEVDRLKALIRETRTASESSDLMLQAIEALVEELHKDAPNPAVVQGMNSYLLALAGSDKALTQHIRKVFRVV